MESTLDKCWKVQLKMQLCTRDDVESFFQFSSSSKHKNIFYDIFVSTQVFNVQIKNCQQTGGWKPKYSGVVILKDLSISSSTSHSLCFLKSCFWVSLSPSLVQNFDFAHETCGFIPEPF